VKQADLGKLGKYDIEGELGKGAMGVVYKGKDPFIERFVALKTVRTDLLKADDPEATTAQITRFKREAQAAGRLNHPNIVGIYEYGEDGATAFIAMEFIEGRDLKDCFDRNERFEIRTIVRIMDETLSALDYAHRHGIVHRDIKPANIMLTTAGVVKITDFGIARLESSNLTQAGAVMGTPSYMSPEQFMGQQVDARSDIFSAGAVLYQMLTGEKPFTGSLTTIMHRVLHSQPEPPSLLNVQIPRAFDQVVSKAMAKRPEDRYQSAAEFAQAIREAAESRPAEAETDGTILDGGATLTLKPAAGAATPAPGSGHETPPAPPPAGPAAVPPVPGGRDGGKRGKGLLIGAAAAVVLVAGAVGGWLALAPHGGGNGGGVGPAPVAVQPEPPVTVEARRQAEEQARAEQAALEARRLAEEQIRAEQAALEAKRRAEEQARARQVAQEAALGSIRRVVNHAPCALLNAESVPDGTVAVTGAMGEISSEAQLRSRIDGAVPGATYTVRTDTVSRILCDPLELIGRLRDHNQDLPEPVQLQPGNPGAVYKDRQNLILELRGPGFPAYLQVDYFTLEGYVVHLWPNGLEREHRLAAGDGRRLGDPAAGGRFWTVGQPFGRELIVAIASARPLFPALRPEAEQAAGYLSELRRALDAAGKSGTTPPVATALFITTVPN
jgi:serine/threonine-protein kinase